MSDEELHERDLLCPHRGEAVRIERIPLTNTALAEGAHVAKLQEPVRDLSKRDASRSRPPTSDGTDDVKRTLQ